MLGPGHHTFIYGSVCSCVKHFLGGHDISDCLHATALKRKEYIGRPLANKTSSANDCCSAVFLSSSVLE